MHFVLAVTPAQLGYDLIDHLASIIAAIAALLGAIQSWRNGVNSKKQAAITAAQIMDNTDKTQSVAETATKIEKNTNGGLTKRIEDVMKKQLEDFVPREELKVMIHEAAGEAVSAAAAKAAKEAMAVVKDSALRVQT